MRNTCKENADIFGIQKFKDIEKILTDIHLYQKSFELICGHFRNADYFAWWKFLQVHVHAKITPTQTLLQLKLANFFSKMQLHKK